MTSRRAPFRTQWIKREETKPAPIDVRAQKAKNLPMPGPGIVVTVPLSLLPEYLQLYGLTPMTSGEVRDVAEASRSRRLPGVLYVKRTPREGK